MKTFLIILVFIFSASVCAQWKFGSGVIAVTAARKAHKKPVRRHVTVTQHRRVTVTKHGATITKRRHVQVEKPHDQKPQ